VLLDQALACRKPPVTSVYKIVPTVIGITKSIGWDEFS